MRTPRRLFAVLALIPLAWLLLPAPTGQTEDEAPARREVVSLIAPRSGEVIADLGCGRGTWTFALARAVGEQGRVYAVDIDADVLAQVRKEKEKNGIKNVEIIQSLPDDPLLPDNTLDAVFLNDVVDYVTRDALVGFLDGIRRSLKERGRLIIRDPNGNPDRVIAECYRAGFSLVEAKVPLPGAPARSFSREWYALKFQRAERRHAILPRQGRPKRYRTRLHIAEELFRSNLIDRKELRAIWDRIASLDGDFDPRVDEHLELLRAAETFELLPKARLEALRKELAAKR